MEKLEPEELISRFLSGEATTEEQLALHEWVSASPLNQTLFQEYIDLWNMKGKNSPAFSAPIALQAINKRIDLSEKKGGQSAYWLRIAASLLVVSLLGAIGYWFTKANPADEVKWNERSTLSGQKLSIQLADGSKVMLNSNSTLKWPTPFGDLREVYLAGEAFFEVTRDTLHPFVVRTANLDAKVLGTSFNVLESDQQVAVTVATGKVQVANSFFSQTLAPSEKLTFQIVNPTWKHETINLENELAWKNGILLLSNLRLDEAAEQIENWFGVKIDFKDAAVQNCRITAKFKNETLKHVLESMSDATGIRYTISNQKVTLLGEGCK
jgi:ferric-dicitrate binding protein FerR (iron transport regulator)